jgi:hypothetical protein
MNWPSLPENIIHRTKPFMTSFTPISRGYDQFRPLRSVSWRLRSVSCIQNITLWRGVSSPARRWHCAVSKPGTFRNLASPIQPVRYILLLPVHVLSVAPYIQLVLYLPKYSGSWSTSEYNHHRIHIHISSDFLAASAIPVITQILAFNITIPPWLIVDSKNPCHRAVFGKEQGF